MACPRIQIQVHPRWASWVSLYTHPSLLQSYFFVRKVLLPLFCFHILVLESLCVYARLKSNDILFVAPLIFKFELWMNQSIPLFYLCLFVVHTSRLRSCVRSEHHPSSSFYFMFVTTESHTNNQIQSFFFSFVTHQRPIIHLVPFVIHQIQHLLVLSLDWNLNFYFQILHCTV